MNQHTIFILLIPLFLLLAQTLYRVIYTLFVSPLKEYPGPLSWRISRALYLWSQLRGNITRDVARIHRRYGPVVRIGPSDLSYTTAPVWSVWSHRKTGEPEFEKGLKIIPVNGVRGILSADRENHARYRRLLSHSFSNEGLREQEPTIGEYVDKLMNGLACRNGVQDLAMWFNWTTFDLIGDLAFGESFGCLDNVRTHPWIKDVFYSLTSAPVFQAAKAYGLLPVIALLSPKRIIEGRLRNYQYVSDLIDKRVVHGKARGDFFDHVLKQDADKGMTHEELKSNASNLVLAGSETTATLLSGCVFHLLTFPQTYAQAVHEVRSSFNSVAEITLVSTTNLPYLSAVLSETMRAYAPVPTFASRVVPPNGDTVDGHFLPGGTEIHMMHHVAYNLPSNFAAPDEFHPERWFPEGKRPKEFDDDNRAVFQPFSVGPRNCIGQNLAYFEMRLVMARLLFRFDLSKPATGTQKRREFDDWIKNQKVKILWEKGPLWVDVTERELPQT